MRVRRDDYLKHLAAAMGASSVVIGCYHFAEGVASVPGATDANATVDSRERFYSAIFAGYGLAWLQAARRLPVRDTEVRALAGVMLAGGVGRLISVVRNGRPHWFQNVLTGLEFAFPAAFFALTTGRTEKGPGS